MIITRRSELPGVRRDDGSLLPLGRVVGKPSKWSVKLPKNQIGGDYSREGGLRNVVSQIATGSGNPES